MMTPEQIKVVSRVYRQFSETDEKYKEWTTFDEAMSLLCFLDDKELVREADVMMNKHSSGNPRCTVKHLNEECFVPHIIEAVQAILDLYAKTENMHSKNRFILEYYLALSGTGEILY